jgi:hypothetical protein
MRHPYKVAGLIALWLIGGVLSALVAEWLQKAITWRP